MAEQFSPWMKVLRISVVFIHQQTKHLSRALQSPPFPSLRPPGCTPAEMHNLEMKLASKTGNPSLLAHGFLTESVHHVRLQQVGYRTKSFITKLIMTLFPFYVLGLFLMKTVDPARITTLQNYVHSLRRNPLRRFSNSHHPGD